MLEPQYFIFPNSTWYKGTSLGLCIGRSFVHQVALNTWSLNPLFLTKAREDRETKDSENVNAPLRECLFNKIK